MAELTLDDLYEYVKVGPVLLLITAPTWCMPCMRFHPHWDAVKAGDKLPGVIMTEIDAGATPDVTFEHWVVKEFNVLSVPTVLLFNDGTVDNPITVQARAAVPFVREVESLL